MIDLISISLTKETKNCFVDSCTTANALLSWQAEVYNYYQKLLECIANHK